MEMIFYYMPCKFFWIPLPVLAKKSAHPLPQRALTHLSSTTVPNLIASLISSWISTTIWCVLELFYRFSWTDFESLKITAFRTFSFSMSWTAFSRAMSSAWNTKQCLANLKTDLHLSTSTLPLTKKLAWRFASFMQIKAGSLLKSQSKREYMS